MTVMEPGTRVRVAVAAEVYNQYGVRVGDKGTVVKGSNLSQKHRMPNEMVVLFDRTTLYRDNEFYAQDAAAYEQIEGPSPNLSPLLVERIPEGEDD